MNRTQDYGPLPIRIGIGVLFLAAGFNKLSDPSMTAGFLGSLGFGSPALWAWLLLLSEIIFGFLVLAGYWVKVAVWPLILIMAVAVLKVYLPAYQGGQAMALTTILFHILAIASLVSLFLTGAGKLSLEKPERKTV